MTKQELASLIKPWDTEKQIIAFVQWILNKDGYDAGKIDGVMGNRTRNALSEWESNVPDVFADTMYDAQDWPEERKLVAIAQRLLQIQPIEVGDIDGYVGQLTEYAIETYIELQLGNTKVLSWRDEIDPPNERNQSEMFEFFGEPGTNHATLSLPFPMRIAWNTSQRINRFAINQKCLPSAERIFATIADEFDMDQLQYMGADLFGGCYNNRKVRGGSKLSTHAFACAIDLDPSRNQLKWGRDRAFFAKPECKRFVDIWYDHGWINLGVEKNFDWMHFSYTRLK